MRFPKHLLPSEQWGAFKERFIHERRKQKATFDHNNALKDDQLEPYLKTHFCPVPFETMETLGHGSVNTCCPEWLPKSIGDIDDLGGAWKSRAANDLRRSIVDGNYKYCNHTNCMLISNRWLESRDSEKAKTLIRRFETEGTAPPPREVRLSHDRSCNLSCPSCRSEVLAVGKAKQKRLDDQLEESFVPVLEQAQYVYITGSGDPFASAHFRRLIKRLNRKDFLNLRFRLHTNAQLLDERAWKDLDLSGRVESMQISIDAAEAETYAIVRRGGTFARLLKNLAFVKTLRETGDIGSLEISMVVQALNFREMPAFVRLGQWVGADRIIFEMIRDWGVYTSEEFVKARVDASHPEYPDLVEVLASPLLTDEPRVVLGNLTQYVRRNPLKQVA